jgi:hypothetical protein
MLKTLCKLKKNAAPQAALHEIQYNKFRGIFESPALLFMWIKGYASH